jgi:hypothetical protein
MVVDLVLAIMAAQTVEVYVSTHRGDAVPYARVTMSRNGQPQPPAPTTDRDGRVDFTVACAQGIKFRAYYVSGTLNNNSDEGACARRVFLKFWP